MVADTRAGRVARVVQHRFAQLVAQNVQVCPFGTRKKSLPDATAGVIIPVVRYLFLVIFPNLLFPFELHDVLRLVGAVVVCVGVEEIAFVVCPQFSGFLQGCLFYLVHERLAAGHVENAPQLFQ